MKTKTLILLAIVAVATLSFTLVNKQDTQSAKQATNSQEPIGGFVSEGTF